MDFHVVNRARVRQTERQTYKDRQNDRKTAVKNHAKYQRFNIELPKCEEDTQFAVTMAVKTKLSPAQADKMKGED